MAWRGCTLLAVPAETGSVEPCLAAAAAVSHAGFSRRSVAFAERNVGCSRAGIAVDVAAENDDDRALARGSVADDADGCAGFQPDAAVKHPQRAAAAAAASGVERKANDFVVDSAAVGVPAAYLGTDCALIEPQRELRPRNLHHARNLGTNGFQVLHAIAAHAAPAATLHSLYQLRIDPPPKRR